MCRLTELQKRQLIQREPQTSVNKLIEYIQKYENLNLSDFPNMSKERREYIEEQIKKQPNLEEQKEWSQIQAQLSASPSNLDGLQLVLNSLGAYIRKWEGSRPTGNHVDEARDKVKALDKQIQDENAAIEADDWETIDPLSTPELIGHFHKYPHTSHKTEIDDSIWGLVNKENVDDIQNYLTEFPAGAHRDEAKRILDAIVEWDGVKNTNEIFAVNEYIQKNPSSPFKQQAAILLMRLKQEEIDLMRTAPNKYEVSRMFKLIKANIVSERELINAHVVTENVLKVLGNGNVYADLPDIRKAIADSHPECKDGYTDVFFFGIPSTGKTCVLMGLSLSDSLYINLASGGGDYAAALQQYTSVGVTVPPTPGDFVTTLEATISPRLKQDVVHKVNLVEMSGEEFAFSIACHPDHVFCFEDMGSGATELLSNNNRKVFFLVIDPTTDIVRINREIFDGYNEETGLPMSHLESCSVHQRTLIQKMVNLFQHPGNSEIMKKVDSIHIIMTKSDLLGNTIEREDKALELFQRRFGGSILGPLIELCKENNINSNTGFAPKLYTYSLGAFYVGGVYEYIQTDSDRLVMAIVNSTHEIKKTSFWDKVKNMVN